MAGAFDGRSLVPLLEGGDPQDWRTSIFATHDAHRVEPAVPSRSVRFGDWKYIRTWGEGLSFENAVMLTSDTWHEMVRGASEGDAGLARRVQRLRFRPSEELYDLGRDPEELVNLAEDPGRLWRLRPRRPSPRGVGCWPGPTSSATPGADHLRAAPRLRSA